MGLFWNTVPKCMVRDGEGALQVDLLGALQVRLV
jgi:hypothetical protein